MAYLYDELKDYSVSDYYPFHMPGHKRRLGSLSNPFSFDITEIEGFDNLHHAEGILAEAQQRAADLYGAEETFFLINGSTCGILSAIGACAPSGKLLMSRNSHKAAYHAVFLNRLEAVYLYPEHGPEDVNGPVRPEDVETALNECGDIRAVFITSPTYDGVVSDVKKIGEIAHRFGIPLIVDSAHGAHFGLHPGFPESAVKQGADLVIHSLHKTLPSLTQTALLHVNGSLADRRRIRKLLGIYQSSSPSYVLMSSIDECIRMIQERGQELFEDFVKELRNFRESAKELKILKLIDTDDPSKILISAGDFGLSGLELSAILREEYHLEPEMAAGSYVLALSSVGDDAEGFRRLLQALRELDGKMQAVEFAPAMGRERRFGPDLENEKNEICMTVAEAENSSQRRILLEKSAGCICGEYIYLYPPGIPLVVPGEKIGNGLMKRLLEYREQGYSLQGMEDFGMETIWILDQGSTEISGRQQ